MYTYPRCTVAENTACSPGASSVNASRALLLSRMNTWVLSHPEWIETNVNSPSKDSDAPMNFDASPVAGNTAGSWRGSVPKRWKRGSAWASLILFVIFAYPGYALSIKRRHDRDNNGMDFIIYLALTAIVLLLQALGIGWETTTVGSVAIPTPAMWLNLLNLALGIFAIYMLVVLGFLKGTAGPNQYGPDPLGGAPAAAAA